MGIFNKNIFKDLENGLKNFGQRVQQNIDNDKKLQDVKCPNCGSQLEQKRESKTLTCEYCKTTFDNPNYTVTLFNRKTERDSKDTETKTYPVLVVKDSDGFYAYDEQTDTGSEYHDSVAEALKDLKEQMQEFIQESIDEGGFEFYTEAQLLEKKNVQKTIQKQEAKIKTIELSYKKPVNYDEDPDW